MSYLKTTRSALATFLLAVGAGPCIADVPETQVAEVEYLINYLEHSGCRMVRNGKSYDGAAAANHVRRKYDYFRDEITSTREFIEYAATESTMSGRIYQVHCPGVEPVPSSDWLMDKLEDHRSR